MSAKKSKFAGLFGEPEQGGEPQQSLSEQALVVEQPRVQEIEIEREEGKKKSRKQGDEVVRVKTNYEIREDYVRAFRIMAASEGRKIYQLLEEAIEQYLASKGKDTQI
jgi:hypothetical protein